MITLNRYEKIAKEIGQDTSNCPYCLKPIPLGEKQIDHIQASCLGGTDQLHNLVVCCQKCNLRKSGRFFIDWMDMLDADQRKSAHELYLSRYANGPEFQYWAWYVDHHHPLSHNS